MNRSVGVLRWLIFAYQGLRHGRPSPCRFQPSCSNYALEALDQHGAVKGVWMACKRIVRCRPGARWGFDPVPPRPKQDFNE